MKLELLVDVILSGDDGGTAEVDRLSCAKMMWLTMSSRLSNTNKDRCLRFPCVSVTIIVTIIMTMIVPGYAKVAGTNQGNSQTTSKHTICNLMGS